MSRLLLGLCHPQISVFLSSEGIKAKGGKIRHPALLVTRRIKKAEDQKGVSGFRREMWEPEADATKTKPIQQPGQPGWHSAPRALRQCVPGCGRRFPRFAPRFA